MRILLTISLFLLACGAWGQVAMRKDMLFYNQSMPNASPYPDEYYSVREVVKSYFNRYKGEIIDSISLEHFIMVTQKERLEGISECEDIDSATRDSFIVLAGTADSVKKDRFSALVTVWCHNTKNLYYSYLMDAFITTDHKLVFTKQYDLTNWIGPFE